jgi:hypothetical protein
MRLFALRYRRLSVAGLTGKRAASIKRLTEEVDENGGE